MKATISSGKASEVYHEGKWYLTNRPIEMSLSEALRIRRTAIGVSLTMSAEKVPYNPEYFKNRKFAMIADIDTTSGWGNVGLNLVKHSAPQYDISLLGRTFNISERSVISAVSREIKDDMGILIHEQPKHEWFELPFQKKIAVVPFETSIIPASWVDRLNDCTAVIVPCEQNRQAFIASGVIVPIEIVHWGVDGNAFRKLERPNDGVFTFGTMGALSKRKGTDMLVRAFLKAFPTEKDVKLLCKTSNNHFIWANRDPRIEVDMTPVSHEELMNGFFRRTDCFVFPTRGEGWGMPITEAMATGIPAIVTNWSGPTEFMNEDVGYLLKYTMVDAEDFSTKVYKEYCGQWAEPSEEQLVRLMRHAYEHQDEVKQKGEKAAEHVRKNFTWEKSADMLSAVITKYF
jgi:glycosyltransferase involved in cell wall biosynthesis